jgi:hypothetical protein
MTRLVGRLRRQAHLTAKQAAAGLRELREGAVSPRPVAFVAGVQRSGTNMLMDLLDESYETDVFHERDPRAFQEYELRSWEVLRALVRRSRARLVVFKALCELQDVRRLLDAFAPARAVWLLRRYPDVVNSHLALWHRMPEFVGAIVRDREGARWRGRGMSDATHRLVRALYHPELSNASACALFWYFRNVLFFEQGLDRDPRVLLVRYEDLVRAPAAEGQRIFDFLGVRFSPAFVRQVSGASVGRRAEPAVEAGVREQCEALTARFDRLDR